MSRHLQVLRRHGAKFTDAQGEGFMAEVSDHRQTAVISWIFNFHERLERIVQLVDTHVHWVL